MTGSSFEEGELEAAVDGSGAGRRPRCRTASTALLAAARTPTERRLYRSMLATVAGLARAGTDVIDLKVADTALAEMAEAFRVFQPLRGARRSPSSARPAPSPTIRPTARPGRWPPPWPAPAGWW